jgi:hypothetical protein
MGIGGIFGGANVLDWILGLASIGGSYGDWLEGKETREYWQGETKDAKERIWGNGTEGFGLRDRLFNGTDSYQGMLGIVNDMLPQYQNYASGVKQGAKNLQSSVGSGYDQLGGNVSSLISGSNRGVDTGYRDLTGALGGRMSGLQSGMDKSYADRTATGMGMLEGMGQQAKADIRNDYSNQSQSMKSDMASRGLGGTAVGAVMDRGIQKDQQNALGRVDESLRQQKLNTYSDLTADELASRSNLGLAGIELQRGLGSDRLLAKERGGMAQAEAAGRIGMAGLDSMSNLGQWGLGVGSAADEYALNQELNTKMLPHQMDQYLVELMNNTTMGMGLPPENPSFLTRASTSLMPMWMTKNQPKPESDSSGGIGFPGFNLNW